MSDVEKILDGLDDVQQHAAVKFAMGSGVPRLAVYGVIEYLLSQGKPGGRRAASAALAEFHGAEANALAMRALRDPDPLVQANVVVQLRAGEFPACWRG